MRFHTPLALVLTLSAAACATPKMVRDGDAAPTIADLHKIKVEQAGERMEIPLGVANGVMTAETAALVDTFGHNYRQIGHGALVLSTPAGASDADAAARLAQAVRMELVANGVPFAAIAGSTYDASGKPSAPLVLSYTRYTAEAPNCAPIWTVDLTNAHSNAPPATFGCWVNANLAAMISDPADLTGPRPADPRDGARRDVVLDKYRNGEVTHATRSNDESVAISTAVQ